MYRTVKTCEFIPGVGNLRHTCQRWYAGSSMWAYELGCQLSVLLQHQLTEQWMKYPGFQPTAAACNPHLSIDSWLSCAPWLYLGLRMVAGVRGSGEPVLCVRSHVSCYAKVLCYLKADTDSSRATALYGSWYVQAFFPLYLTVLGICWLFFFSLPPLQSGSISLFALVLFGWRYGTNRL